MQSPRLPWEVIERVIGHSGNDPRSLCSFSLTCRELLPRSRCLMLAGGVKLRGRDHAFALVDFLEENPHLKSFISSIIVKTSHFPPFPLLYILSDLSEIIFTETPRGLPGYAPVPSLHPSTLTCFQRFGSNIHTLRLIRITFSTSLALSQLLLAFSSITHLICKYVTIDTEGNQAPLAVAKRRLSEKLQLQSLVSDSWSLVGKLEGKIPRNPMGDVLLDPNFKLALSTVERLEITDELGFHRLSSFRLPEWSQLQFLGLSLYSSDNITVEYLIQLLNSVNSTMCQRVTVQFHEESPIIYLIRPHCDNPLDKLEHVLLKFSQVDIIWNIKPLRPNRNSFWTQELRTRFSVLFQHPGAAFQAVLKSRTDKLMMTYEVFPVGHDGEVSAFVISPDSKWIASGSEDSTIIIWDTRDGSIAQQWVFPGYKAVWSLAFSPDSRCLVGSGWDGKAVVWELSESARPVATLEGHTEAVTGCAWSPDGTIIVTASSDIPMQIWDARTFHTLHVLRGDHRDLRLELGCHPHISFSPDGRWLASACSDRRHCYIWNIPGGTESQVVLQNPRSPATNPITPVFDLGSGRFLTTPENLDKVEILNAKRVKKLFALLHEHRIKSVSFSSDGRAVLAAPPSTCKVEIWDLDSGIELWGLKRQDRVCDAHLSPCGKYVAYRGDDYKVILWRISDRMHMAEFSEHKGWVTYVAFSPDGKILSSAAEDGSVVIRHMCDIVRVEQDT